MADELPQEGILETGRPNIAGCRRIPGVAIVLGSLVLLHVTFVFIFFNPEPNGTNQYLNAAVVGVIFSQPLLFAFWAAFAARRFYHRFLWAFLLCTVVSFTEEAGFLRSRGNEAGMLMIIELSLFILAAILFSAIRRFSGWQIQRLAGMIAEPDYRAKQFGIKHLIILNTIAALAIGLLKTLWEYFPRSERPLPQAFEVAGWVGLYLLLLFPVFFLPWYTLAHRAKISLLIVFSSTFMILIDIACFLILKAIIHAPSEAFLVFPLLQLGAGLSFLMTTLPLRFFGYRMVRMKKAEAK